MHCFCKQKQIYFFPFVTRITDILVLSVLYFPQMQHPIELWLYMWIVSDGNDSRRYIPVHDLCSSLSDITCNILPSRHALTGYGTTSAFSELATRKDASLSRIPHSDHPLCNSLDDISTS